MIDFSSIVEMLPQQAPMRFVESIEELSDDSVLCTATARPLLGEEALPAAYLIEYMAQACACFLLCRRMQPGHTVKDKSGVIAMVRSFETQVDSVPSGTSLQLHASPEVLSEGYYVFSCQTVLHDSVIATANLAIASHA